MLRRISVFTLFALLLAGVCIFRSILFTPNGANSQQNPVEYSKRILPAKDQSQTNKKELDAVLPLTPASSRIARWTVTEKIDERTYPADGDPAFQIRQSLLLTEEIEYPIVVEELIDPGSVRVPSRVISTYIANRLLVASSVTAESLSSISSSGISWQDLGSIGESGYKLFESNSCDLDTIQDAIDQIADIDPDAIFERDVLYFRTSFTPNDTEFAAGNQWGLRNPNNGPDIKAEAGWGIRSDASNTIIAIIDSGINLQHEDLKDNVWRNPGEIPSNGIDDDKNGFIDDVHGINLLNLRSEPEDESGHGTHVAGIAGAVGNNGVGISGVSWDTQLMPIKFLNENGTGSLSNAVRAIDYASKMGAHVINASWEGNDFSSALEAAIKRAGNAGSVFVAAAGNEGYNIDNTEPRPYPASYRIDNLVAVASINRNGELSQWSNYGSETVQIAAPGEDIYSSWIGHPHAYKQTSGTSMAAPHVSGVLALLHSQFPADSPALQIRRLEASGTPLNSLSTKIGSGKIPNLQAALSLTEVPLPPELDSEQGGNLYHDIGDKLKITISDRNARLTTTSYQWFHQDTPIAGATESSLELTVTESSAGTYRIDATNEYGLISRSFELRVFLPAPELAASLDLPDARFFAYTGHQWTTAEDASVIGGTYLTKSVKIGDYSKSLALEVEGPGQFRFNHKSDSDPPGSGYRIQVGDWRFDFRAKKNWEKQRLQVDDTGSQTIEWYIGDKYARDLGQDQPFFLDSLQFFKEGEYSPYVENFHGNARFKVGETATISVAVEYDATSFRWLKDGKEIAITDGPTLEIVDLKLEDSGNYALVASNQFGADRGTPIQIVVYPERPNFPYAGIPNFKYEFNEGDSLTLAPNFEGAGELDIQWHHSGKRMPGENDLVLSIDKLTVFDSGDYQLVVKSPAHNTTLTGPNYNITVHPKGARPNIYGIGNTNRTISANTGILIEPKIQGTAPLTYQWYIDNNLIPGATNLILQVDNATEADAGTYHLIAKNRFGSDRSPDISYSTVGLPANLATILDSNITWQSAEASILEIETGPEFENGSALKILSSNTSSDDPFILKGTFEGDGIIELAFYVAPFANYLNYGDALRISVDGNSLYYSSILTIGWSTINLLIEGSGPHSIEIKADRTYPEYFLLDNVKFVTEPRFLTQPQPTTAEFGKSATFSAEAFGQNEVSYQWYRNNLPIEGATAASYTIEQVTNNDSATFHVVASNLQDEVSSDKVELKVIEDLSAAIGLTDVPIRRGGSFNWYLLDDGTTLSSAKSKNSTFGWIEFTLNGPSFFTFESLNPSNHVQIELDGEFYGSTEASKNWKLTLVKIGEGSHTVRLISFKGRQSAYDEALLKNFKIEHEPVFTQQPQSFVVASDRSSLELQAILSGTKEATFKWYRNGLPIGQNYEYITDKTVISRLPLDDSVARKQGRYHCEATLPNGIKIKSKTATVTSFEPSLEEVGFNDPALWIQSKPSVDWKLDYEEYSHNSPALRIESRSDFEIHTGGNGTLSFWAKTQNLSAASSIYLYSDAIDNADLYESYDWNRYEIPIHSSDGDYYLYIKTDFLPDSDSTLWLENISFDPSPIIVQQPYPVQAQLGGSAQLEAEIIEGTYSNSQWFRNGEPIQGANGPTLAISSVSNSDYTDYHFEALNEFGTKASDIVSITPPKPIGYAVEAPYLTINTGGHSPWSVDTSQSFYNDSSLVSGPVAFGETSYISFDVIGPTSVGFFARSSRPETTAFISIDGVEKPSDRLYSLNPEWSFHSVSVSKTGIATIRISTKNDKLADPSVIAERRIYIDRLTIGKRAYANYQDWIASERLDVLQPAVDQESLYPDHDLDGNGVLNVFDYLVVPSDGRPQGTPILTRPDGQDFLSATARIRLDPKYYLNLEVSDNLADWQQIDPTYIEDLEPFDSTAQDFEWIVYPKNDKTYFFRWKANVPERTASF